MLFETPRIEVEWNSDSLFPMTRVIVHDAQAYALARWNWTFFLTCIWRSITEDTQLEGSGIHSAWRAVDVRDRDQAADAIADVTKYLNGKYVYDPGRPRLVVCYSKPHGSGPHLHLQAHQRTALSLKGRPSA
jgi:hypothetical protein